VRDPLAKVERNGVAQMDAVCISTTRMTCLVEDRGGHQLFWCKGGVRCPGSSTSVLPDWSDVLTDADKAGVFPWRVWRETPAVMSARKLRSWMTSGPRSGDASVGAQAKNRRNLCR